MKKRQDVLSKTRKQISHEMLAHEGFLTKSADYATSRHPRIGSWDPCRNLHCRTAVAA